MPTGKLKWFDVERGFGFVAADDGGEVFLHASALPAGVTNLKPGTRLEFGVADGRRGPQALAVQVVEDVPSFARNLRMRAEDMVPVVEDLIKMLDSASNQLRRGHYPDKGKKLAQVMRVVADNFDA